MFVQDFVRIDRPLDVVIETFERHVVPRLGDLVRDTWDAETEDGADRHGGRAVPVAIGQPRTRLDGLVYAIGWPADGIPGLPEFDADLEFAPLNAGKTHVELSGQTRFPAIEPWSSEDRRANRRVMAALGGLLSSIAAAIEVGTPITT